MKKYIIGIDIGGTKCAVLLGRTHGGVEDIITDKLRFETRVSRGWRAVTAELLDNVEELLKRNSLSPEDILCAGISCGGPLDSRRGVILSPPNLPGWDCVPIVDMIEERFRFDAYLQNDANACALAEWQFGAGAGTRNMIFLTFGTGLGAGLILDGRIYTGTNDNAGELGHIRLSDFGPVGYGKCGSFEGFCSGGGIRQLAQFAVKERLQMGEKVAWCPEGDPERIDARLVAQAAAEGDVLALEIYRTSARYLGRGLSIVIDLINPEMIVIGSIYARNENLMKPYTEEVIAREALSHARRVCRVVPAALGEAIGDYAALSVAANA